MGEMVNVPVEWRADIHPRRGGIAGPKVVLDEDAARRAREWEREARPIAVDMMEHERTSPELGQAVRAWLDGEADPVGAAAVAAIAVRYIQDVDGAAFLDAWVLDHGLAFAACAVTEASSIELGPVPQPARPSDVAIILVAYAGDGPGGWRGEIRRTTGDDYVGMDRWIAKETVVKRLRTLLAAASESEYRAAVERLSAHRGDALRRFTAAYLVPTEVAWVDEVCNSGAHSWVLGYEHMLSWLSSAAQLERIHGLPVVTPAVVGTLLDGLGADAFPLLDLTLRGLRYGSFDADEERAIVLRALLEIPDERVFHLLLDQIGEEGVPAALHEAAERYPAHALRALAPVADDGTTRGLQAAGLLRGLLYADPDLAKEVPSGAVDALSPRPAVPDADDLPGALAGKPARSAKVDWADPASLPRILTRGGDRALPATATRCLLNLLAKKKDVPEIATVRELCDRHSLAEFSWAVFQRWHALGAPSRHNWALAQLGLIGDDTTVRRLSPLIKQWPGEGLSSRAAAALDVFARIGSDVALAHLFELTRRGKYKGLKGRATQKIDEIAAARGITPDALADRAVPDFGLDDRGTLILDYGPRRFTVTFDQQLVPLVVEPNGKIRKSAPKPGPKDDPALAPAAHALFNGLRKDLRTIADQEIKRLELAMIRQRSWTPDDFHTLFVTHPLLRHIVHRLVWISHTGTGTGTAFRIAEDDTYADVNDDTFTPAPGARIAIAHPILLDDDLGTWAGLFADYEILQPFDQLERPVYRLTDDERAAHRLARVEGLVLSYGQAKGYSQGRWGALHPNGGSTGWLARRDPAGLYVVADLYPGLGSYMYGEGEDQEIRTLWAGPVPAGSPRDSVPLGKIHPVTMSEAIHDLVRSAS
jgi:hypothetical protein